MVFTGLVSEYVNNLCSNAHLGLVYDHCYHHFTVLISIRKYRDPSLLEHLKIMWLVRMCTHAIFVSHF